ncbi:hypothetical protein D3C81_2238010 [compost metagenome]
MGLAALGVDGIHQRLQLVGVTASHAGHITLAGKTPGDGAARGVAGTYNQHDFLVLRFACHVVHPLLNDR